VEVGTGKRRETMMLRQQMWGAEATLARVRDNEV